MPINLRTEKTFQDTDGLQKQAFIVSFTNGAKDQLTNLKAYFKQPDELELLKLAISFLQKFKEDQEKEEEKK